MRSDQLEQFDYAAHEARTQSEFKAKLTALLNECSRENASDTPDFILADYLLDCLETWNRATTAREQWYQRFPLPTDPAQPPA